MAETGSSSQTKEEFAKQENGGNPIENNHKEEVGKEDNVSGISPKQESDKDELQGSYLQHENPLEVPKGSETAPRKIETFVPVCPAPALESAKSFKPHWRITSTDLKKIVVMPEYLAEAMADAVSSNGADVAVAPPSDIALCAPQCPILVFINSRSGGLLGPDLLIHLSDLISPLQVYDLARTVPEDLFRYGLGCLEKLALAGDGNARVTRNNLRILVAGGDGTVGWVLTSMKFLLESPSTSSQVPPVGIIPLGTGNDLSRSFGWGGRFSFATRHKVKKWLVRAVFSTAAPLDSWQVLLKASLTVGKPHLRLPHCLSLVQHPPTTSRIQPDAAGPTYTGIFRNYFSVGMDAQVAFGFHNFRNHMPWIARGRLANQMIYGGFSCTQGWFCTSCSCSNSRGVKNDVRLFVKRRGEVDKEWEFVYIPSNIRAIVILNLQSYAGGRNPWGRPGVYVSQKKGFQPAAPDDGLLEIVGLRDGWHAAFVMISALTAIRLCQAEAVRLEMSGNRTAGYLQMDGEPWQQPLSNSQQPPTVLELTHTAPSSVMLRGWRKARRPEF